MTEPNLQYGSSRQSIVTGALESLYQMSKLLGILTPTQYTHICAPYMQSAMGNHVRHVLDMFYAFKMGVTAQNPLVDYDIRRRGASIESCVDEAVGDINGHIDWLNTYFLQATDLDALLSQSLDVSTEVCLSHTVSVSVKSNVARELIFIASHAVHHFAILGSIAKLQNITLDENFGVAPATRTFLRTDKGD